MQVGESEICSRLSYGNLMMPATFSHEPKIPPDIKPIDEKMP
jgi:hypothetical protein